MGLVWKTCRLHSPYSDLLKHKICWNKRLICKKEKKRGTTVAFSHTEVSVLHTPSVPFCSTDCISKALQQIHSSKPSTFSIAQKHLSRSDQNQNTLLVETQSWILKDQAGRVRTLSGDGYRFSGMELDPVSTSASTHRCSPHQEASLACAANHLARQHLSCSTDTPSCSTPHPHPACQPSLGYAQQLEC